MLSLLRNNGTNDFYICHMKKLIKFFNTIRIISVHFTILKNFRIIKLIFFYLEILRKVIIIFTEYNQNILTK